MKIEIDGNDSLSIEHKEEIHIFHKSTGLLMSRILNSIKHIKYSTEVINKFTRNLKSYSNGAMIQAIELAFTQLQIII